MTREENENDSANKSSNFLTLSSNSNFIQHVHNDGSSPLCSGSRHSSISINFPAGANDLLHQNYLMPPRDPCASRSSTSSAWNSLRLSALSLSRVGLKQIVFFVRPCSKQKCCLGCISLHDAIPLICTVEMFTLVFCTTFVLDLWINDGKTFYTNNFEGHGADIAICYFLFLSISLPVILFTLWVWRKNRRRWYILHVVWQWTSIEIFVFFLYTIISWATKQTQESILIPSAFVFGTLSFLGAIIECWWLVIFVDAMLFERRSRGSSGGTRKVSHETRGEFESESSNSPTSFMRATVRTQKHST